VLLFQAQNHGAAPVLSLRYGVAAFGTVNPLQSIETLAALGFDYAEPGLSLTPLSLAPTIEARLTPLARRHSSTESKARTTGDDRQAECVYRCSTAA